MSNFEWYDGPNKPTIEMKEYEAIQRYRNSYAKVLEVVQDIYKQEGRLLMPDDRVVKVEREAELEGERLLALLRGDVVA